jgi:hypothetical protein
VGTENEFGTISGFTLPVVVSSTAKLRITSRRVRAQKVPDESRYGENRGKKSGCLRRSKWEKCFLLGGRGAGGGAHVRACVRACVHAPFDLPPIAYNVNSATAMGIKGGQDKAFWSLVQIWY